MDFWNWLMQQRSTPEFGFMPDAQLDPSQVRDIRQETEAFAPWARAPFGGEAYDGPGGSGYPYGPWSNWLRQRRQNPNNWRTDQWMGTTY